MIFGEWTIFIGSFVFMVLVGFVIWLLLTDKQILDLQREGESNHQSLVRMRQDVNTLTERVATIDAKLKQIDALFNAILQDMGRKAVITPEKTVPSSVRLERHIK